MALWWKAVCRIWLAGLQSIVRRLHANTPACIWKAMSFLNSSSRGIAQKECMAPSLRKNLYEACWSRLLLLVACLLLISGNCCWLIKASIVSWYEIDGWSLVVLGSRLGAMTKREKHPGSSHFSTTGLVLTKCSRILLVAGFPRWWFALMVGSALGFLPGMVVVYWSIYGYPGRVLCTQYRSTSHSTQNIFWAKWGNPYEEIIVVQWWGVLWLWKEGKERQMIGKNSASTDVFVLFFNLPFNPQKNHFSAP